MSDTNRTAVRFAKEPSFAAPIGGAYATGTITFSGAPANNDTVTINGDVYTFKTTMTADKHVAIGTTAALSATNLADAINANQAAAGTGFYVGTIRSAYVIAYAVAGVVTVYARTHGTGPNSYTLAESGTQTVVSGANLTGGLASNYATMTGLRYNSHTLKNQKVTVESEEIRSDRTAFGMVKVGISAGGDINHELHWGDLNGLIASALMGAVKSGTNTQAMTISNGVLTPAGDWSLTPDILNAKFVRLANRDAANNGIKRVLSISGNALTLEGVVDEVGASGDNISFYYVRQGTLLESYVVETEQVDAGIVVPLTGMCLNTWGLSVVPRQKVMTRFGFLGYGLPSGTVTRTDSVGNAVAAPSLNPIINATSHVARLLQNGKPARTSVSTLDFELNNNLRDRLAVGREGTLPPGTGEAAFTGRLNTYFDDKFEYDDFLAHTDVGLEFTFQDSAGRVMNVYCPGIQLGDGSADVPGSNQDVFLNRTFKAKKAVGHDGTQFQCQVDMLEP